MAAMLKRLRTLFHLKMAEAAQNNAAAQQVTPTLVEGLGAEDWQSRGNQHIDQGDFAGAERCYRNAITANPAYAQAHNNLGLTLKELGQLGMAREHLLRAAALDPTLYQAQLNLGEIAREQGELQIAAGYFERCLAIAPDDEDALLSLVYVLFRSKQSDKAKRLLDEALVKNPDSLSLHFYLGNLSKEASDLDRARLEYERCRVLDPGFWPATFNLGLVHQQRRDWDAAKALLRQAAEVPGQGGGQLALGELLLLLGELPEGFSLLEQRFDCGKPEYAYLAEMLSRFGNVPRWQGESLAGKKLLVWAEQGLGDTLMMARYLPRLKALGAASLVVYCQSHLVRVFDGISDVDVVESQTRTAIASEFDLHCSMMSLPHLLQTRLDTVPAQVPYLFVPDGQTAAWAPRLASLGGLRVGLAWAGNPMLTKDALRSIPLRDWTPVMNVEGVSFISLQKSEASAQLAGTDFPISDWMTESKDLLDTAGLIANLDLVICVDTSIAHLAGALGKPVWLLNRHESEWRWLLDRTDSPWYPTMQIFRQHAEHDWRGCMRDVAIALKALAGT
jgi:tetratricopeptide (TPR) repeat protein